MKLLRSSVIFMFTVLAACTSTPAPLAARTHGVLFPLAVGEYWVYEISAGNQHRTIENRISASHTIGDTEWFLSVEYGENFWIRNSPEGQVEAVNLYNKGETSAVFEQLDAKTIHEELLYKFPVKTGDSWVTLENVLRYEGKKIMTVPAGTFECHDYSITQYGQTYSRSCIAEGVGVVYSDNTLPDGTLEVSRLKDWGHGK